MSMCHLCMCLVIVWLYRCICRQCSVSTDQVNVLCCWSHVSVHGIICLHVADRLWRINECVPVLSRTPAVGCWRCISPERFSHQRDDAPRIAGEPSRACIAPVLVLQVRHLQKHKPSILEPLLLQQESLQSLCKGCTIPISAAHLSVKGSTSTAHTAVCTLTHVAIWTYMVLVD